MSIAKLTKLPPVKLGFVLNPKLPVISYALEVSPRKMHAREVGSAAVHAHPRGQLLYASSGVMRVICGREIWVVLPSQAIWIPPDQKHEVSFSGDTGLRSLFVDPSVVAGLPTRCKGLKITPLLRALILRAVEIGNKYTPGGAHWRVIQVFLDELRAAEETPLRLPMARDQRATRVMTALLRHPGDSRSLSAWGRIAGASDRTLARLFVSETGLTFGAWRKRLLLQEALDRLDRGEPITNVAFDLGYRSVSAFIAMFRKELGDSPRRYTRKQCSGESQDA